MEKINEPKQEESSPFLRDKKLGRIVAGLLLVAFGALFLARSLGTVLPDWLFGWKMLLTVAGFYFGVVNRFRGIFWLLMFAGGLAFLANDIFPQLPGRAFGWPVLLIVLGIYFIIRPKRKHHNYDRYWKTHKHWQDFADAPYSHEDFVEAIAVFGQVKKTPISKKFQGGDIVAVFGGVKINLSQADIEGTAAFDFSTVFGGIQLIIPPHWKIKSDAVAIFGGIDDKRQNTTDFTTDEDKTLILTGAVVFGGIEIKSY